MVERLYVEKKKGFDVEAQSFLKDFKDNIGIPGLVSVRILNRYDVEGITKEDLAQSVHTVFSEPPVDMVFTETDFSGKTVFGVEYLPGQYDQRADSAAQCVQLLTRKERPAVRYAKIFVLEGKIDSEETGKIKKYVINPVDSREASLALPETLEMKVKEPEHIETVFDFIHMDGESLADLRQVMGFAMSEEDLFFTQEYFRKENRDPTVTELRVIDTYWSDHCRHTTFLTKLTEVDFGPDAGRVQEAWVDYLAAREAQGRKKDVCLMDIATAYVREAKKTLKNLDESEEINACSIKHKVKTTRGDVDYLIMFKNETHNHPTEIEPFGGAATCLGGAIRDPLSGRSYVYQAMRVTGSADPRESLADTMEYKLPQRKITREAAQGYSSYGNQIGLATGMVHEVYHPGYKAKRMEIGAVIGAAPARNVVRERPDKGDVVILIGGATGRDGCGGATGSSKAHDERSIETCGAEVQKGNPLTERKLQRLFRKRAFSRLIKRCNDFGAGGVSVAIGELAPSLDIDLDAVPKKYEGLNGTELAISESQERMAVVVAPGDLERVLALAAEENLDATPVAKVTDSGRLRMFWRGQAIVDMERGFVDSNGAPQYAKVKVEGGRKEGPYAEEGRDTLGKTLLASLADLNICSQKGLIEMFDGSIGAASVTMPLGGKYELTPVQAMAARVPCEGADALSATLMSFGTDPYLMSQNPYLGAVCAVLHSVAKIAAAGGRPDRTWLTLQEYFERLGTDPARWGKPFAALLGAYTAQKALGIAAIGGKDSMSGSFMDLDVPPTLCSFAVCVTDEPGRILTPEFKQPGSSLYLMDIRREEDGMPDFEDVKQKYELFYKLAGQGKIRSAWAVDRGGVLAGAAVCALGSGLGVRITGGDAALLTQKLYGSLLVEAENLEDPAFAEIGEVTAEEEILILGESVSKKDAMSAYTGTLESVFPTRADQPSMPQTDLYSEKKAYVCRHKAAHPKALIPVFPGTNCEYDSARAFERAGGTADVLVIQNRSAADIEESIRELKKRIENAQIIMIPGGFSGGDEPEGSGKFIATTFRNPAISDAVMDLLKNRDGLMLGICNGFQALIKLGLVPYGEIRGMRPDGPTLTYNTIGRHMSRIVRTRVASVSSPWLAGVSAGDVHTVAVSHGEGRFVAGEEELASLFKAGQVAFQYVDEAGQPSMDSAFNPNGSMWAVEGIMSADGRVLGKMGHSERAALHTFKNIPGDWDQKIFESGVRYFK
jgi:phosphoribosylformylglycinamidine synthase